MRTLLFIVYLLCDAVNRLLQKHVAACIINRPFNYIPYSDDAHAQWVRAQLDVYRRVKLLSAFTCKCEQILLRLCS